MGERGYGGTAPLTAEAIENEADTFTNARLWDYRPLQTTLDQLQAVRQYYDFHDVDTDRYVDRRHAAPGDAVRPRARDRPQPAGGQLGQPAGHLDPRHRRRDGPGQRGHARGPAAAVGPRPAADVEQRGAGDHAAADLLRRERQHYVVVRAQASPSSTIPRDTSASAVDRRRRRGPATTGIPLDSTLDAAAVRAPVPRPRPADLGPGHRPTASCCSTGRCPSGWAGSRRSCATTRTRTSSSTNGQLVYVQDAYTISDKFPHATWFNTSELGRGRRGSAGDDINYIRNSVKITMDAYDGTMHFYVADPTDPLIRAWEGIFPTCSSRWRSMPAELQDAPPGARGAVQRPDPDVRPVPRRRAADVLQQHRPLDGARRADQPAEPRRPRRTTS